ncbi:Amino acid transporter [Aphelenchoides bicaudatus]|nr:Amino acid transporter [Aphelenchoides bicaudatus]
MVRSRTTKLVIRNLQLILTLVGVAAGVIFGCIARSADFSPRTIEIIGLPGELLMNMLTLTIVPLVGASLISGLAGMEAGQSGKNERFCFLVLWNVSFVGYHCKLICKFVKLFNFTFQVGIILVLLIHPGDPSVKQQSSVLLTQNKVAQDGGADAVDKLLDLIRSLFPENIVQATFQSMETSHVAHNLTNGAVAYTVEKTYSNQMNLLGFIVFCVTIGSVIHQLGEEARPLKEFFIALDLVVMKVVNLIMWYSPIGIASLIAAKILEVSDLFTVVKTLALYIFTVGLGEAIHIFVTLPTIYFISSRKNPFTFMRGLTQAATTALGTASGAASLPISYKCLEENNGIDSCYTRFILPVGGTINMDGTALYEAVASIFIAQINGVTLSGAQLFTAGLTSALAAVSAAPVPSSGLVTMMVVLSSLGLPVSDISLIIAVDWFIDRLRTCANVMGNCFACGFVQHMCQWTSSSSRKIQPINSTTNLNGISPNSLSSYKNNSLQIVVDGDTTPYSTQNSKKSYIHS